MTSSPSFKAVHDALGGYVDADPTYSAQLCVHVAGERVVDVTCGAMQPDSLLPVFSSSKGATAVVVALLVDRGQLDLDATVAHYWPEFAAGGKGAITVRQLLSHQAGLPGVDGGFTWEELLDHDALAERLAAQRPFWQPGQAFLYHALTIGTLADELVRRIDGRTRRRGPARRTSPARVASTSGWARPSPRTIAVVEAQPPTGEELHGVPRRDPDAFDSRRRRHRRRRCRSGNPLEIFVHINGVDVAAGRPPASGMLASGRGLAALYASLRHEVGGQPRVLSDDTIGQMSQIQVPGIELGTGLMARFGVIFQAPAAPRGRSAAFGAFGHDGAGGSLAFCDPAYDLAFGYTVQRLPLPGGMDPRAVELSAVVRDCLR